MVYQPDSEKNLDDWQRQVRGLLSALREYGAHKKECSYPDGYSCNCGFSDRYNELT